MSILTKIFFSRSTYPSTGLRWIPPLTNSFSLLREWIKHKPKKQMKKTITYIALVAAGTMGMANAALTYFNLGGPDTDPATTTIASGPHAGTWHNVIGTGTTNVGSTASVAPVTADGFTVSWVGGRNPADAAGANYGGNSNLDAVSQQILWGTGGGGSTQPVITITGLSASTQYNITVFSGINTTTVDYTLDVNAGGTGSVSDTGNAIDSDAEWASGTPFTTTVTTGTGAGSDTITLVTSGGNATPWGLGIETVPEPSSAALLGLGGLALILRRRK